MTDKCPNCGTRRGDLPCVTCNDPWHWPSRPELMFSFRSSEPGQHSTTVSESRIKKDIADARRGPLYSMEQHINLANAAERMIELAKAPRSKLKLSSKSAESIRRQLAQMLGDVGLNPDRFLVPRPDNPHGGPAAVHYTKEPSSMCTPGTSIDRKADAERASIHLSVMLKEDLSIIVTPILLRLWLVERWSKVAELAHKIHGAR